MHVLKFEAIGTPWSIETASKLPDALQQKIHERIELFDKTYSRFRDDSLVAKLSEPGTYTFPDDAEPLLNFYHKLYIATEGSVTPLIGKALEQAGYDASYSLKPKAKKIAATPKWDTAMKWTENTVEIKQPVVLDIGAAGKGYLIDIIAELLEAHDIVHYTIDASGDIRHRSRTMEKIGLEDPRDSSRVVGTAHIKNTSLCASAINRRKWGDWHHVIDARTGRPVNHVIAVWVIADSTMIADGLATALFFVPPGMLKNWEFQSVRLFTDGRIEKTAGFVGELFV